MYMAQSMPCKSQYTVEEAWKLLFNELERQLVKYFQYGPSLISSLSITPLTEEADNCLAIIHSSATPELKIARQINGCSKLQRPMRAVNEFIVISRKRPENPSSGGMFEFQVFFSTAGQA